jgi:glycosyltransferase involved in cell wall biosynthesis
MKYRGASRTYLSKVIVVEPKRILILDTGKEWGGGTNSLLELLKRIDRNKFSFTALFYVNYLKGDHSSIGAELEKLGIPAIFEPLHKSGFLCKITKELIRSLFSFNRKARKRAVFWTEYWCRIKPASRRISILLHQCKSDLLYMNNQPSSNLEGLLAAQESGIPVIQHARITNPLNPTEVSAANKTLERMICVSSGLRDYYISEGIAADKCVTVHNGIDINSKPASDSAHIRQQLGLSHHEILIGTVGQLVTRKRVHHLITAFAAVRDKTDHPMKCLIVGDGPEMANLKTLSRKLGVFDDCIFTGFKTDPLSFTNAMDIFVLASVQEGLPRVILEAMLMGKPVIAATIPGPAEQIIHNQTGFLFAPDNVSELTRQLEQLTHEPTLRARMGEAGRQRVIQNFSIESYVSGVEHVLLENHPRGTF